jgi:hypothetical protein
MKHRLTSLLTLFGLVALLGLLQQLAFAYYLYWVYPWYDIMMHFLGGAVVASSYIWVVTYELPEKFKRYRRFAYVLAFSFFIGILWEVFEYLIGIDREYSLRVWQFDTVVDIIMDLSGAALSFVFFTLYAKKN